MLDTIALMLPESDFSLCNPERFAPHAGIILQRSDGRGALKAIYILTPKEKLGGYKPQLTLYRLPTGAINLRVQFSAPKIVRGNNFVELTEDDKVTVLSRLNAALKGMGVIVDPNALLRAEVSKIDYSKNVLLERSTPCWLLIRALAKLDLSQRLDLSETTFRNSGQMIKYHANSYEIVIYDKVRDLEQATIYGDKRGAEAEYIGQQNLFNRHVQKPEVLRIEIRLTRRKLKNLFKKLGIVKGFTFDSLFSANISRAILLHYWDEIVAGLYVQELDTENVENMIHAIHTVFPGRHPGKVTELMGFAQASQQLGLRGARLALNLKPHQFHRLKKSLKMMCQHTAHPRFSILKSARKQLVTLSPVTFSNLGLIQPTL